MYLFGHLSDVFIYATYLLSWSSFIADMNMHSAYTTCNFYYILIEATIFLVEKKNR